MKAIINTNIVMPDHMIPNGAIVMDGDRIVDFGKNIQRWERTAFWSNGYGKMMEY